MIDLDQTYIESQQPDTLSNIRKLAREILLQALDDIAKGQGVNQKTAMIIVSAIRHEP